MSEYKPEAAKKKQDRKLGDEWLDWDGRIETNLPSRKGVFVGVAALVIGVLIGAVYALLWLIEPRIVSISPTVFDVIKWGSWIFCCTIILWLVFFLFSTIAGISLIGDLLLVPRAVNWLLNLALKIGKLIGISNDRLVNSFMQIHSLLLPGRALVSADDLLVLAPRCLNRESNRFLRDLRDKYKFQMAVAGGGQEARKQIANMKPKAIIAIACERDLLSGFVEVNPRIRVVGVPNERPEGPCKNTVVDTNELERLVRKFISAN